jgi:hypothetical protein
MSKGNNIVIDGKPIDMSNIMKRMQFVEDIGSFTRKFTRIYVEDNQLYIGHTINRKKTKIEYEDMVSWINYFDRI